MNAGNFLVIISEVPAEVPSESPLIEVSSRIPLGDPSGFPQGVPSRILLRVPSLRTLYSEISPGALFVIPIHISLGLLRGVPYRISFAIHSWISPGLFLLNLEFKLGFLNEFHLTFFYSSFSDSSRCSSFEIPQGAHSEISSKVILGPPRVHEGKPSNNSCRNF